MWNIICTAHSILGIWVKIEKLRAGKRSIYIHTSEWHAICLGALSPLTVIRWRKWRSGPRWCRSWQRCTCAFAPSASLWILCCAILARKRAICWIFPNRCRGSFYCRIHHVMPGNHNKLLRLISNFCRWFLDYIFHFLNGGARRHFLGHCGHIQSKTHVGLFMLYPTSLAWHGSWHVENLQEVSCCSWSENRLLPEPYTTP